MTSFLVVGRWMLRAVFLTTVLLAPFAAAQAQTRVGVTQATSGDPLGRPPVGVERVLRVGTDVQANEAIITASNDRAHLIFLDGTTLTVGPDAQLVIDKFVYDQSTQQGELNISAAKGVMRVIGGRISKNNDIIVKTPSSTIGIRGGIMHVGVTATQTTSIFIYGDRMTISAGGQTTTVTVPGLQVSTQQGGTPGPVTVAVQATFAATVAALAGNTTASAAVLQAIATIVTSNLTTAQVQVALTNLIQTAIASNAPTSPGASLVNNILLNTFIGTTPSNNGSAN